jgi:hypothetical protein
MCKQVAGDVKASKGVWIQTAPRLPVGFRQETALSVSVSVCLMKQMVFMEHLGRLVAVLVYFVSEPVRRGSMWAAYPFGTFFPHGMRLRPLGIAATV